MAIQKPRLPLAHSEALRSCCGAKLRVSNTCVFARDFDFPGGDAQRCSATDCTKASWRNPTGPENRTSVAGCVTLLLKFAGRAFQATVPRCFLAASSASPFAVVVECRAPHLPNLARLPSSPASNRQGAEKAAEEFVCGAPSSAKPNTALLVPRQANTGRS